MKKMDTLRIVNEEDGHSEDKLMKKMDTLRIVNESCMLIPLGIDFPRRKCMP